jgi:hypothetical protein
MNVLRIERKQNVGTVANLYSELKSQAPNCAVQVPSDLDEYRLCGKGEFLQFLLTWAASCPDAPVVTHISSQASSTSALSQLRKLFSEEHGFLLGLLTRRFGLAPQRHFLNTSLKELSPALVEDAFATCRIFEFGEPLLKRSRAFLAMDDLIDNESRVLNPYTKVYLRRNANYSAMKEAFSRLLIDVFKRTPRSTFARQMENQKSFHNFVDRVTRFTYELFENADRWGALPYQKSIRGILLHLHFRESIGEKPFHVQVGLENPLTDFLQRFVGADNYERTAFLELTVFDNGPTLATHFLGKEPKSLRAEYNATADCLLLASGRSSKWTEGKGLYETMKLLNSSGGFVRYRAKRLSLYRDFLADPIDLNKLEELEAQQRDDRHNLMREELVLKDWLSRTTNHRKHTKAVGTFFTIIVPVEGIPT